MVTKGEWRLGEYVMDRVIASEVQRPLSTHSMIIAYSGHVTVIMNPRDIEPGHAYGYYCKPLLIIL